MTETQAHDLLVLHDRAVKAGMRWQAATPGTKTARELFDRAERAEKRFVDRLNQIARNTQG